MTNEQISKTYQNQLNSGKTFVADIQPRENGNHAILLVQRVSTSDDNPLAMFIGSTHRILRCIQTATSNNVNQFQVGMTLDFDLVCKESFEPSYEGQPHKINPSTNEPVLINGCFVYETTRVPTLGEKGGIFRIERKREAVLEA